MKVNKVFVGILVTAMLVAAVLGITAMASTEDIWSIGAFSTYVVGDEFTIPAASITVNGESVSASGILIYPDGSATKNQTVTLSAFGRYTVSYTAQHNGKTYAKDVTFDVTGKATMVSSEKSSVSYGKYVHAKDESGLMVRLAEGDTLTFSKAIDVSNLTSEQSLIKLFATPDIKGAKDFKKIVLTLTDSEDPSIQLTISVCHFWDNDSAPASYILAGGQNQAMTGYEAETGKLHIDDSWGTPVNHSFSLQLGAWGIAEDTPADELQIDLRYDTAENSLYSVNRGMYKSIVTDFDNSQYYSTFWNGFPSGKVFLSVKGAIYSSQTANFCITHVAGIDLTEESFVDSDCPTITVDAVDTQMPDAKIGTKYPIPHATAFDMYSGDVDVQVSVWYNYLASNAVLVPVTDGSFVPSKAGQYVIEYAATDYSGNVSKKLLTLDAKQNVTLPDVRFTAVPQESAIVGDMLYPVAHEVSGSGNVVTLSIQAKIDGTTIPVDEKGIRLTKVGSYEIIYTVTDYIGQISNRSYKVEVTGRNDKLFLDAPVIPQFFISGNSYTLADLYAYDYSTGTEQKVLSSITVTDANGTRVIPSGEAYVPQVNKNGDVVKIVYSVGESKLVKEIPGIVAYVTVNDRDRLALENYIHSTGISVEKLDDYMILTAKTQNAGWTFANSLVARKAGMVFAGIPGKTDFQGLKVFFIDANDSNNIVTVTFTQTRNGLQIEASGSVLTPVTSFAAGDEFDVAYNGEGKITINGSAIGITVRDDGQPFQGFSGNVYVGMQFVGAKNAQIKLVSVDGQPMKNVVSDRVGPKIVIEGTYGGCVNKDSVVTLPAANAGDALAANISFTMSVVSPSGEPVTDVNGLVLKDVDPRKEYSIKATEYGQYKVSYTAAELNLSRANTTTFIYVVNVTDTVAPEIQFQHAFQTTVNVDGNIILPVFTLTDNVTAAENIICIKLIITPDGRVNQLPDNCNAIQATQSGIYEIRIVAFDEAHNIQMVSRFVEVK